MKRINREKLIFVTGMVEGMAFVEDDISQGEALNAIREQIESVLKDEEDVHA